MEQKCGRSRYEDDGSGEGEAGCAVQLPAESGLNTQAEAEFYKPISIDDGGFFSG